MENYVSIVSGFANIVVVAFVAWELSFLRKQTANQIEQSELQIKQANLQLLSQLHIELLDPRVLAGLDTIFHASRDEILDPKEHLRESIAIVTGVYDLLAVRFFRGVFTDDDLLYTEWKILLPLWLRVEEFIKSERDNRGIPSYKADFEELVKVAARHVKDRDIKVGDDLVDLVDRLV